MLKGKNIVVGISGGIAAYKAADVVSRLKKLEANVYVIMTKSSTEFVAPLTFQSLSQNYVVTDMFEDPKTWDVEHIALAKRADLFLIVPATANIVGKVANGIADDMLTTTVMATVAPVYFALAMNTKMYENPIFNENVAKLKRYGYHFIEAGAGRLACGDVGAGKLEDPETIVSTVVAHFNHQGPLKGKHVLVTAGPTREAIDPVRFISNESSGKMGYALAEAAMKLGANVTLISGPTALPIPNGLEFCPVVTTEEMLQEVLKHLDADIIIKAAAPSDYRVKTVSNEKIKKNDDQWSVELVKNADILKSLGPNLTKQVRIGFAAETSQLEAYAKQKLQDKYLDAIVANDVSLPGAGFNGDTNIVTIFCANGKKSAYELMSKKDVAKIVLDHAVQLMNEKE